MSTWAKHVFHLCLLLFVEFGIKACSVNMKPGVSVTDRLNVTRTAVVSLCNF